MGASSPEQLPLPRQATACPQCRRTPEDGRLGGTCPEHGLPLVPVADLDDPMIGRSLEGRYTLVAKLGAGSMGTVYRARHHAMARDVAIKILRSDRAADEAAKGRFLREARANSLLVSPNTVTVFDFGESASGEFYLAMEMLDGESLGQRLAREGRLPPGAAVAVARQALRSLAEAHAKGIVHRDLKPDNLFFARLKTSERVEEVVKVLDFGIAKMMRDADVQPMQVVETQAGTVFGTPRYMSPEQAQGKPLDARSDLYSLGVILYQMLTGSPPFTDDDAIVVMARHIKTAPKRFAEVAPEAGVPPELEDVVQRVLSKDPDRRPENAEVLSAELAAALDGAGALVSGVHPASPALAAAAPLGRQRAAAARRTRLLVLVGVAFAVGLAALALATMRRDAAPPAEPAAATTAPAPVAADPAPTPAPTPPVPSDTPTVSADALPRVRTAPAPAAPPHPRAGRPAPHPPKGAASGATSTAPAPAPASPYGIFD